MWRRETVARLQQLSKYKRSCHSPGSTTPLHPVISTSSPPHPHCTPPDSHVDSTITLSSPAQKRHCMPLSSQNSTPLSSLHSTPLRILHSTPLSILHSTPSMCSSVDQQLSTPLDLHGYAKAQKTLTPDISAEELALTHSYSRKTVREQASRARTSVRRTLETLYDQTAEAEVIEHLTKKITCCNKIKDVASVVLSTEPVKEEIEKQLLDRMNSCMQTLFGEGENSSRLGMTLTDDDVTQVLEIAVTEMNKRVPFLFRVLSTASGDSQGKKQELYLGVIYGMLMRQRSQRMNIIQRLITATCLRYHASNEV